MKLLSGLCAAAITIFPASVSAADMLPAMTAAESGGAVANVPAPPGYGERASLMLGDDNFRGTADQLRHALARLPQGSPLREQAEFQLATACAHIPGENAEAMFSDFLTRYPASPLRQRALTGLAGCLFDKEDYAGALAIYETVDGESLNPSEAEEKQLRQAYCLLKFARYDEATPIYNALLATPLANAARFYLAYTDYVNDRWSAAMNGFSKVVVDNSDPARMTPYYLAQLYYCDGDWKKAYAEASKLIKGNCPAEYLPEMLRVAGESLYGMGETDKAVAALKQYLQLTDRPLPSALYIVGVDDYNRGDYKNAIRLLTDVVTQDNAMGQSAYLYIGQSYLREGNYDAALMALDQAVKRDYDSATTELASYNYAVASVHGGKIPFGSSVVQFENFLKKYPDSKLAPEVADYIINGYITDNNYGAALNAINNIKKPTEKVLAAKQQVLFIYGTRQLRSGRAAEAATLLKEARSMGRYSAETASEATLWLGEAQYRQGNYREAVDNYNRFLRETPSTNPNHSLALYDMAYARFALKDFSSAKDYMGRFLKSLSSSTPADVATLKADALNRRGDCSYYSSDFTAAEADYERAIEAAPTAADYPMYQQAIIKGLRRDHQGKIDGLAAMMKKFPNSVLIPSAMLETGESYTELEHNDRAIATYTSLSSRFPSTPQGRQGALLLAIAQLNSGEADEAVKSYKHVIRTYPTSEEARAAAEDLKHIYADRGQVSDYAAFLATVPDAPKMDQSELVALQLEGVEKASESGRNADAVRLADELIAAFPESKEAVSALSILADIHEKEGRGPEALAAYRMLSEKSSNPIDVNRARLGVLRLSRDMGNNDEVLRIASQLLSSSSIGDEERREVMLAQALAYKATGETTRASELLSKLAERPETLPGAKAAYYHAQELFDAGKLDASLRQVNALIDSNTPHEYWLARGFILLSDINRRKGNTFEADEYLRSLRENYPGSETDIFQMIDSRLDR